MELVSVSDICGHKTTVEMETDDLSPNEIRIVEITMSSFPCPVCSMAMSISEANDEQIKRLFKGKVASA